MILLGITIGWVLAILVAYGLFRQELRELKRAQPGLLLGGLLIIVTYLVGVRFIEEPWLPGIIVALSGLALIGSFFPFIVFYEDPQGQNKAAIMRKLSLGHIAVVLTGALVRLILDRIF